MQRSQASVPELAERYGLNEKTIRKWRKRRSVEDARTGPKEVRSSIPPPGEEAMCVAFRRHTLLPLDDCLHALQATIPLLSRAALHRLFHRHDIGRLPDVEGDRPRRSGFKRCPIGYIHIDIAEIRTEEGRLYLFVATDRTSRFAFVKLVGKAGRMAAAQFLREPIDAVPCRIHTILAGNGVQFTDRACDRSAFRHIFGRVCSGNSIEHRTTRVNHPWTNGQVERMNRTIEEATVRRYHHADHDQLRTHLADFIAAYNYARRLKTLVDHCPRTNGAQWSTLTPCEHIVKCWTEEPDRSGFNLDHHMPGPNT